MILEFFRTSIQNFRIPFIFTVYSLTRTRQLYLLLRCYSSQEQNITEQNQACLVLKFMFMLIKNSPRPLFLLTAGL